MQQMQHQSMDRGIYVSDMQSGDRAGDWRCPNTSCVNNTKMVFGSKATCPKCGAAPHDYFPPEALTGVMPQRSEQQGAYINDMQDDRQSADWQCPNVTCLNHTKMVFGSKSTCPRCGAAPADADGTTPFDQRAEKGMHGGDMPGDWQCPNTSCLNHTKMVFAKHIQCPSCGTARNAKQAGDWMCPNVQCVNNKNTVFGSKTICPKCGSPRPGSLPPMVMGQLSSMNPAAAQAIMAQMMQSPSTGNPGDWRCPNPSCQNNTRMVFAKHSNCPKCDMPKPEDAEVVGGGMAGMVTVNMATKGLRGGMNNPGDWRCPNPDCLNSRNQVFAKHATCPNCGTEKPLASFEEQGGGVLDQMASVNPRDPTAFTKQVRETLAPRAIPY